MKHYQAICQSVRGESHIQRGTPKEDAAALLRLEDRIVGAVSDGHGDPRCMRSQIGAQLAVDIALELLGDWDYQSACDAETPDSRIDELSREIVERWNRAVEAHFRENPLTEAELNDAGSLRASYQRGAHISHIYGATLIAFLRADNRLLLLQKGDGHAVVIDRHGNISDRVIPWDDRCYLNVTTSLCDSDAPDTFTHRLLLDEEVADIAALMLGSDGVEDSFANFDLMGAYYGLLASECVENGEAATEEAMRGDLAEMSKYGSKDDISVIGLIDPVAIPPLKPIFERMQARGALALKVESSTTRLNSMSAAYLRREQQLQVKQRSLEEFQRESADLAGDGDIPEARAGLPDRLRLLKRKSDLEALQQEIDRRNGEEARLRKRVSASTADYDKYDRELSAIKLEYSRLIERIDRANMDPLSLLQREYDIWELENCKERLQDMSDAFSEQERRLKRVEQELESWQSQTSALESRKKRIEEEIEAAKRAQRSGAEQRRKQREAELERRAREEDRLTREVAEIKSEFEAYGKKYEAVRREHEQLLAELEKLK